MDDNSDEITKNLLKNLSVKYGSQVKVVTNKRIWDLLKMLTEV